MVRLEGTAHYLRPARPDSLRWPPCSRVVGNRGAGIALGFQTLAGNGNLIMMQRLLIFLLVIGLLGCAEGQKANPLPRAASGDMVEVEPLNPLPKEAAKYSRCINEPRPSRSGRAHRPPS